MQAAVAVEEPMNDAGLTENLDYTEKLRFFYKSTA